MVERRAAAQNDSVDDTQSLSEVSTISNTKREGSKAGGAFNKATNRVIKLYSVQQMEGLRDR